MSEFQKLMDEILEFQLEYFPKSTAISKLHHLEKECVELREVLADPLMSEESIKFEYADGFLLLVGSAAVHGMTADEVFAYIRKKIEINKNRKWNAPDDQGVVEHVRESKNII